MVGTSSVKVDQALALTEQHAYRGFIRWHPILEHKMSYGFFSVCTRGGSKCGWARITARVWVPRTAQALRFIDAMNGQCGSELSFLTVTSERAKPAWCRRERRRGSQQPERRMWQVLTGGPLAKSNALAAAGVAGCAEVLMQTRAEVPSLQRGRSGNTSSRDRLGW